MNGQQNVLLAFFCFILTLFVANGYDLNYIKNMTTQEKEKILHVTVVRYQEDVSHLNWLMHVPHTIYNRGGPLSLDDNFHVINELENVGRESFVYLKHIVRTMEKGKLAKYNIFTQAKQSVVNLFSETDLRDTAFRLLTNELSFTQENDGFGFLIPMCWYTYYSLNYYGNRPPIGPSDPNYDKMKTVMLDSYANVLNFTVYMPRYSPTGVFVVSRDAILRNPSHYYLKLGRLLGTEIDSQWGYFFEQAWPEVFHSTCSAGPKLQYKCVLPNPASYQLPKQC